MPVQEGMATGEGLNLAHQRVVNRLVAVGGTYPARHRPRGRTCGRAVGGEAQFVHCVEDAALHGFEAIADIGQGPPTITLIAYSREERCIS